MYYCFNRMYYTAPLINEFFSCIGISINEKVNLYNLMKTDLFMFMKQLKMYCFMLNLVLIVVIIYLFSVVDLYFSFYLFYQAVYKLTYQCKVWGFTSGFYVIPAPIMIHPTSQNLFWR